MPHEHCDLTDGHTHVATGANLISHDRDPFLPADAQAVIVAEDGLWNVTAQFGGLRFDAFSRGFAKLQCLELQEVL
jgi:hypothetical protein